MRACLDDILALGRELLGPTLVAAETHAEMVAVQFPGLDGVLPDFGRFSPMDWGLGVELKTTKQGHWTGSLTSPPPSDTSGVAARSSGWTRQSASHVRV